MSPPILTIHGTPYVLRGTPRVIRADEDGVTVRLGEIDSGFPVDLAYRAAEDVEGLMSAVIVAKVTAGLALGSQPAVTP